MRIDEAIRQTRAGSARRAEGATIPIGEGVDHVARARMLAADETLLLGSLVRNTLRALADEVEELRARINAQELKAAF